MQKEGMGSNTIHSHILKPLLNGCLTGQLHALFSYCNRSIFSHLAQVSDDPNVKRMLHDFNSKIPIKTMLRMQLLAGVTHTTASLGIFEILTKKLRITNDGRPLTLYQEACCGLTSGATAAFVWQPFVLAYNRVGSRMNLTYRNWFSTLCHIVRNEGVLTLWRGSGLHMGTLVAANVGMLASYNRSLDYLRESEGLSPWKAQTSASIISGFFAAACSHPYRYLKEIKDVVQKQYHGGERHAYRNIPFYISRILTPHSGFKFYSGFLNSFQHFAAFCMVQWWIFEEIRTAEE